MATDRVGREFIMWYLKTAFDAYQKVQNRCKAASPGYIGGALSPATGEEPDEGTVGGESQRARGAEPLQELRSRISELEGRLQKPKRKKPRSTAQK